MPLRRIAGAVAATLALAATLAPAAPAATSGGRAVPSGSPNPGRTSTPPKPSTPRTETRERSYGPTGGARPGAHRAPPREEREEPKPDRDEPKDDKDKDRDRGDGGPNSADIPSQYLREYRAASEKERVSWRLLAAIGKLESDHGRSTLPGVRSGVNGAGCCSGPMQMCTVRSCGNTWQAYARDGDGDGRRSVYEPADAILAAAALVSELHAMFGDHPAFILAGYNAGPGNVQKHKGVPPFAETQSYVKRGLDYMRGLR